MTGDGGSVLIGEAKMFDTVAADIKNLTGAIVSLPATDMVEEGEGMTRVAKGWRWGLPAVSSATRITFRSNQRGVLLSG